MLCVCVCVCVCTRAHACVHACVCVCVCVCADWICSTWCFGGCWYLHTSGLGQDFGAGSSSSSSDGIYWTHGQVPIHSPEFVPRCCGQKLCVEKQCCWGKMLDTYWLTKKKSTCFNAQIFHNHHIHKTSLWSSLFLIQPLQKFLLHAIFATDSSFCSRCLHSVREGPYTLCPLSQKSPQDCHRNSTVLHGENFVGHYVETFQANSTMPAMLTATIDLHYFLPLLLFLWP